MPRTLETTTAFRKDLKRERKAGHKDFERIFRALVTALQNDQPLDQRYRDHPLTSDWKDHRDLHLKPDLVLIYRKAEDPEPILTLVRLGSHAELFG